MKFSPLDGLKIANDVATVYAMAHAHGVEKMPSLPAIIGALPTLLADIATQDWDKLKADLLALVA